MVCRCVPVPLGCFLMAVDVGVVGMQGRFFVRHGGAAVRQFGIQVSSSRTVVRPRRLRKRLIGVMTR